MKKLTKKLELQKKVKLSWSKKVMIFLDLRRKNVITRKENNYFRFNFKKATNLGKIYLLPMIHKGLWKVAGRPVISNCGTLTEKASEFFDHHLQSIMKQDESYRKDKWRFFSKT